uniref:Uncharacterized protein n=1 Tax=Lepeophtheirus salmonis TaxID=72036 RepID=A0A0K2T2V8_LEPSM
MSDTLVSIKDIFSMLLTNLKTLEALLVFTIELILNVNNDNID